jgi:hypothetical protein
VLRDNGFFFGSMDLVDDTSSARVEEWLWISMGKEFVFQKCQRSKMGRPLLPSLFNLVADVFSTLFCRGSKERVVVDLVPHLVKGD